MADRFDPRLTRGSQSGSPYVGAPGDIRSEAFDAGLRSYMLSIYNYMASGVLFTGIIAMVVAGSGLVPVIFNGGLLMWAIMLSPLAIVLAMSFGYEKFSAGALQVMFWLYAALTGLSMALVFALIPGTTIALAFFSTAAAFAGLSLWGYTTKKDLSGWGSFLLMGLIGLIVASLINWIAGSSTMNYVLSFISIGIFAGLTAYETQRLKSVYAYVSGTESQNKVVIMGALMLYIAFMAMFRNLLFLLSSQE
ncbi:MAG: Bax inhibitor-1/YccA family protein [Pseudomonadota bacterium]